MTRSSAPQQPSMSGCDVIVEVSQCNNIAASVESLDPAGRSQFTLDCHFMSAMYTLVHSRTQAPCPELPLPWPELLRCVAVTAMAEGTASTAEDAAIAVWKLFNTE